MALVAGKARFMGMRVVRLTTFLLAGCFTSAVCFMAAPVAMADARSDFLIRTLQTSDSFRGRAQAALSLGRIERSEDVVAALSAALRDPHPAVRTAAAASIERLEDPAALPSLRLARRDQDAGVREAVDRAIISLQRVAATQGPSGAGSTARGPDPARTESRGPVRFYVGVGQPGSQNAGVSRELLEQARQLLSREIGSLDGVEVAPDGEPDRRAGQIVQRRRLTGYYIDSSVLSLESTGQGTRVAVSIIVGTYPGRDMRAMLQGAATAPGGPSPDNVRRALESAIRGVLRRLPQAFEAGAQHAQR